jgi:hypothetical protein
MSGMSPGGHAILVGRAAKARLAIVSTYYPKRPKWNSIGYVSPMEFERQARLA